MAHGITIKRVVASGPGYTKVEDDNGRILTIKGTVAWRAHNPGNLRPGKWTSDLGAVGVIKAGGNGKFLVFPDAETGARAQAALQFANPHYANKTIAQAIASYAPSGDNNNPGNYAKRLADSIGVSVDTKLADLTPQQRTAYLAAQRSVENNSPGQVYDADGTRLPMADVPYSSAVGTQLDTSPLTAGLSTISHQAGRVPLPAPEPLVPPKARTLGAFGGRLPADAMNGVDRLVSGKRTNPPTDFATDTGSPDQQLLGMTGARGSLRALGNSGVGSGFGGSAALGQPAMFRTVSEAQNEPLPSGVRPHIPELPQTKTIIDPTWAQWDRQYGTGGANATLQDIHDRRDGGQVAAQQSAPPEPPKFKTIEVPYRPVAPQTPTAEPQRGLLASLGSGLNDGLNFLGSKATELGTAMQPAIEQGTDAVIKAAIMSPKARGAIIDPYVARIFTDKPMGSDPATKYGATPEERQLAAQNRDRLSQGLPPLTSSVATQLSVTPDIIKGGKTGRPYTIGKIYSNGIGSFLATPSGFQKVTAPRSPSSDQRGQGALRSSGMLDQFGMTTF